MAFWYSTIFTQLSRKHKSYPLPCSHPVTRSDQWVFKTTAKKKKSKPLWFWKNMQTEKKQSKVTTQLTTIAPHNWKKKKKKKHTFTSTNARLLLKGVFLYMLYIYSSIKIYRVLYAIWKKPFLLKLHPTTPHLGFLTRYYTFYTKTESFKQALCYNK